MKHICPAVSLCLMSVLTGCQSQAPWHLTVSKKSDTVQLCLSHEATCPQPGGVTPAGISVYRYDSTHDNELVWDAEPDDPETGGNISGVVTYGVAPRNWSNKVAAPPLVCGKAYLVNPSAELFALKCDGSVVALDFPHLEEFFRQASAPETTKTSSGHEPSLD
ncbi:MAG TPA: hypothetical protein VFA04_10720 [Bryobacteraceae bacterium]|nr:hypothetical protein [Bryobacteraceae bacterium]